MNYLLNLILCFASAVAFGILINAPIKMLIASGIVGSISWLFFLITGSLNAQELIQYFVSAAIIRLLSLIAARILKTPSTVICIPSLVAIVPGSMLYRIIRNFVEYDIPAFTFSMLQLVEILTAIIFGFVLADSLFTVISKSAKKR